MSLRSTKLQSLGLFLVLDRNEQKSTEQKPIGKYVISQILDHNDK